MDKQQRFDQACENGDFKTIKALINHPDADPSFGDNFTIRWAAYDGHKEVVEFLLTDERVMDKIEYAFEWCNYWGGYELLKACVERQEKERRVQEAIEEMSADCELYF